MEIYQHFTETMIYLDAWLVCNNDQLRCLVSMQKVSYAWSWAEMCKECRLVYALLIYSNATKSTQ